MEEYKQKEFEQREHEKKVEEQKQRLQARRNKSMQSSRSKKKANHSAFLTKQAKYIDQVKQLGFYVKSVKFINLHLFEQTTKKSGLYPRTDKSATSRKLFVAYINNA